MRSCVVGQKTPIKMIKTCIYFATEPPPLLRVSMTRVLQPVGSQILPHAKASELNYGLETFTNTTPPYSILQQDTDDKGHRKNPKTVQLHTYPNSMCPNVQF